MDTLPLVLALGLIALVALMALRRVPPGHTYTVHRMGRFHRTLAPGFHIVVPLVDRISHRISMLGRVVDLHCGPLKTRDGANLSAHGAVYFQVLDPRRAAGRLSTLEDAARGLAAGALEETVEQLTGEELRQRPPREINAWLLGRLNQSAVQWGVRVTRIELDFDAPEDSGQT